MANEIAPKLKAHASRWMPTRVLAVKITLGYALGGVLWIFFSGWLLHHSVQEHELEAFLENVKGWLFVGGTAVLLGWLLDRYFREIRESAELLQESEQRWQFAVDGAGDGVWDWNAKTDEVFYSDRWKSMLGYAAHEIGSTFSDWESRVHPEDLPSVRVELQKHLDGLTPFYLSEHRMRCKDGGFKWVLDRGKVIGRTAAGKPLRVIGTHSDISERRQAAEALAQAAVRRQILVEQSSAGIVVLNGQGGVLEANPSFAGMLGYSVEEIMRLHVWDWDLQWSREQLLEMLRTADTEGRLFETRHRRKDGCAIDVEVSTNGTLLGGQKLVFCVCRDISRRKQSELALQQSEEKYRSLVETTFDWVWEVDAEGRYTYASAKVKELLGYTPAEVLGRKPFDFMPAPEAERVSAFFAGVAQRKEAFSSLENVNLHQDGRVVILESSAIPVLGPGGELKGYRGMDRDITQRKHVEEALKCSEERFRRVVEMAPDAIFIRNAECFTYLNSAAVKLFGARSADELLGRAVFERFHPDHHEDIARRMRAIHATGEITSMVSQMFLRLDGSPVPVQVSAVPFTYQGQSGALVFAQDTSRHKLLEAQLRQAQKLEAIGQLAGGVAHDFNNILAAIMMHLGLLKMNERLDPETLGAIAELEVAAQRAAGLTRQLLMFGRRSVLAVNPLNLNDVVANLLKMLTRLIGEAIDLRFDGKAALPLVSADVGMIEQVLMNLVVNARDAIPRSGKITIQTGVTQFTEESVLEYADRRIGSFVCLVVSDTGSGMDAPTLKRIFEPFFTTKDAGKGTGLGLATVHGIVAQHGGWIEVESTLGQGSAFSIFLPALAVAAVPAVASPAAEPVRRGQETILVVEDELKVRQIISQSLRVLGYRVHEAGNGREAMALWQLHHSQVALLLTDMVMPEGMTGLELAERLQGQKPGLKVIISSGYSAEIVQAGVPTKSGVTYLPKPYQMELLARLVREAIDRPPGATPT